MRKMQLFRRSLGRRVLLAIITSLVYTSAASSAMIVWQEVTNPFVKEALYDAYRDFPITAITKILVARDRGWIKQQQKMADMVLAGLYLEVGASDKARLIFSKLDERMMASGVGNQAWLALAKHQYRRGQRRLASASLDKIKGPLDSVDEDDRLILLSMLQLQQNNVQQAIGSLKRLDKDGALYLFGQYNLAVSLFKHGQEQAALTILDHLGGLPVDAENRQTRIIRDKANLTLGYGYLARGEGQKAQSYLARMRLDGPLSNQALLGLGRAYSVQGLHQQSLVPWLNLSKRDIRSTAVQEGMMSIPYALGRLTAYKQSLQYYQQAMEQFRQQISQVNQTAEAVAQGGVIEKYVGQVLRSGVEGVAVSQKLPPGPETHYLWSIYASNTFQESLKNYARIRLSLGVLEQRSASLSLLTNLVASQRQTLARRITQLQSRLLRTAEKTKHYLQQLAFTDLEKRKKNLIGSYNEARFAVAQIYDYAGRRWGNE